MKTTLITIIILIGVLFLVVIESSETSFEPVDREEMKIKVNEKLNKNLLKKNELNEKFSRLQKQREETNKKRIKKDEINENKVKEEGEEAAVETVEEFVINPLLSEVNHLLLNNNVLIFSKSFCMFVFFFSLQKILLFILNYYFHLIY